MITPGKNQPRPERRLRLNTMATIALAVTALAAAAPLAAAESDPTPDSLSSPQRYAVTEGASGPSQPLERHSTVALACSPAASYVVKANTPSLEGSSVKNTGSVTQTPNWYCLVDQLWLRGQTKVCGFWGCNWHTKASTTHNGRTSNWSDLTRALQASRIQ